MPTWYKDGPPISHLSLPVVDIDRPWGNTLCNSCKGFCSGHYLVKMIDTTDKLALKLYILPSSQFCCLRESPQSWQHTFPQTEELTQKALLTPNDTRVWLNHLHTVLLSRKRGAAKAAATRRAKRSALGSSLEQDYEPRVNTAEFNSAPQVTTYSNCGGCGKFYFEETDEVETRICCDLCESWFCSVCVNFNVEIPPEFYFCKKC